MNEKSIQLDVAVIDFEDAVRKSVQPLVDNDSVTDEYTDEIIKIYHEIGPYIVLMKNVALPHAPSNKGAKKVAIGFTRLKEPVQSGNDANDPVKYLFPLSAPDSTSHIEVLSELAELLGHTDFIQLIEKAKTSKEITAYLKKIEGEKNG